MRKKSEIEVSIITSAHQVSDARLHRIAFALIGRGLTCEIIAPGKAEDSPRGARYIHAPFSKKFTGRVLRDLTLPWRAQGKVVITLAPDMLPVSKISTFIKRQTFAVDLYEDYLDLLNDRSWAKGFAGRVGNLIARAAISLARNADITSVADEQVRPVEAKARFVLRNLPSLEMLPDNYIKKGSSGWEVSTTPILRNEIPTAIYIGDIRESRGLGWMLEIAESLPSWKFVLIGNTQPADRERIARIANIEYLGANSPQESWKHALGAWVGLSLLAPTPAFQKAIPSKLYEYAAVGLPVISTPLPRPAALIKLAQNGIIVENPQATVEKLSEIAQNPEMLSPMATSGLKWIAGFMNSDSSYQGYFEAVKKGLNPSRL